MQDVRKRTLGVTHAFSVAILLKTLFAPWRRITTPAGKGIDAKLRAMIDNFVSRVVGFTVRIGVLLIALLLAGGTLLLYSLIMIAWPLMPIAVIFCLVKVVI